MMPDAFELARDFMVGRLLPEPIVLDGTSPRDGRVPAVIAIGVFDGVHVGHRDLIARAAADASSRGVACVALTFSIDPDRVVSDHPARRLISFDDKLALLGAAGADRVAVIPFDAGVAALDHDRFFADIVLPALDVRAVHVGSDFKLGRGGEGTVDVLSVWGAGRGIEVTGHELVCDDGSPVSATRVRALIAAGDVRRAAVELGRRYAVRGRVAHGSGQGTGLGFPTANIEVDPDQQLPKDGVYAGIALADGAAWPAAVNVGAPRSFADRVHPAVLEAHLVGFEGDLYGRDVAVAFDRRLRAQRAFASRDELVSTVLGNIREVEDLFGDVSRKVAR